MKIYQLFGIGWAIYTGLMVGMEFDSIKYGVAAFTILMSILCGLLAISESIDNIKK